MHDNAVIQPIITIFDNLFLVHIHVFVYHFVVLVAHNGFVFDFPMLINEIERTPNISTSTLVTMNIHFSDTYAYLTQAGTLILELVHVVDTHILSFCSGTR